MTSHASTEHSPPTTSPTSSVRFRGLKRQVLDEIPEAKTSGPIPKPQSQWLDFLKDVSTSEWDILIASTIFKVLLFPSYHSTDFEVHRNWLAITHSLPVSKWYYDTTSEWTLDYPPFFAYFEWVLSIPASFIDRKIVDLQNLNYDSWSVIAYQRSTVIITELVLGAAVLRFIRSATNPSMQRIISASLFLHPGFLIVDHIHFQYNGFMFGILLWSILMARNGDKLMSGILFAVLLNFKHIYMYLAPAYFIYLLRGFCMTPQGDILLPRFLSLANVVIAVFVLSFGPFLLMGQIPQLLSRLFPFQRGLNHAYWAPNAWALMTALDRVLLKVAQVAKLNLIVNDAGVASTSRGLVGDTVFAVLPNVKPIYTFIVTIAFQSIFLFKLWRTPTYKSFVTALTLCGYTSFMFGWHVHEKAILLVLVPLSLIASENHAYLRTYVIASVAGIFSLFPLLFTPAETFIKFVYSLLWMIMIFTPLTKRLYEFPPSLPFVAIDFLEKLYLTGFPLLQLFVILFPFVLHGSNSAPEVTSTRAACIPSDDFACPEPDPTAATISSTSTMEFLPLMLTSIYCAIGLVWAFCRLSVLYLRQ